MANNINIFDYYALTKREGVVVAYKGPVSDLIMAEISRDIRAKLADNPKAGRKVFIIFMELAQNILYYSAERVTFADRNDSIGTILLTEDEHDFVFSFGNLVNKEYVTELLESCDKINSLDKEGLREFKRQKRNEPTSERSRGAGIGLIHVAITSESPLDVEFKDIDDKFSFFALSVKINKNI